MLSITVAALAAVAAFIAMTVPGNAAAAATYRARPAPTPAAHGVTGRHPVRRACAPAVQAGLAACLALVRTDVAAHRGLFSGGATPGGYGPADLQSAYDLPSATAGARQTVAIVDAYDNPRAAADLAAYRAQYDLPPCTATSGCFRKVAQNGSTTYPAPDPTGGWELEESLDVDMVSAICPKCGILLVEADNNTLADLGAAVDEAVKLGARYVSNSYGGPEFAAEATFDSRYYRHPGVAVTASAGDSGYGVSYPAASQYVTSVGGTTLTRDPGTARGWAEAVWGSSASGEGTGSGCSAYEAKPPWQADTGCAHRTDNDVAAEADPNTGVAVYDTYQNNGWLIVGGTSASSPIIASTFALAGAPATGSYPSSYPYADPSALNDITTGANSTCSPAYLCTGEPGYDGPTGWGTPDGVAAFRLGPHGTISGTVSTAAGRPLAGAEVTAGQASATTAADGSYLLTVPPGTYTITARDFDYAAKTADGVQVAQGQTISEDFALSKQPLVTVAGTVTDGSGHGWPLAAAVSVAGTPAATHTDPATGRYQLSLPVHATYTLQAAAQYPGYQPVQQSVTVGTSSVAENFRLTADDTTCQAPGYRFNGLYERFTNVPQGPPGWTVVTSKGTTAWMFATLYGMPNYTGGSGAYAGVQPGYWVKNGSAIRTDLISPTVNLTADRQPVLRFDQAWYLTSSMRIEADISTDGGHTWSTVWKRSGAGHYWPDTQDIALPAAAGHPDVRVRFQFIDAPVNVKATQFWQLDNVYLGNLPCAAIPGGLVTGQVTDAQTSAPLGGVPVTSVSDPARSAVTTTAGSGRGSYFMFMPHTGRQQFTAGLPRYATGTTTANVRANQVATANVALRAGRLSVTPGSLSVTEPLGKSTTVALTFTNTGRAPVTVKVHQRPATVTVVGAPDHTAGPPAQRVPGTFSPLAAASFPAARRAGTGAAAAAPVPGPPWTPIARYPLPIVDNGVATDADTGDIYSVGGYDGAVTRSGYAYSPVTRAWTALPDLRYPREAPQVAFIGGKLYVTGGWGPHGSPVAALEVYDPAARKWSAGASIPVALAGASVTVADGKMYVIGGCDARDCGYRTVQVYDPATNTWSTGARYPAPVAWASCGTIGARIYCAGGDISTTTGNVDTAAAYVYSLAANTWSPAAPLPYPWWAAGYTATNGRLLVSGGIIGGGGGGQAVTNIGFAYDPASNAWTALPNSDATTWRGGSTCGFYRIGGENSQSVVVGSAEQLAGYAGCEYTKVPWLSENQASFTLQPGQSLRVGVTLNAASKTVNQPGTYTSDLVITQNSPYLALPQVAVDMRVTGPTVSRSDARGSTR